MRGGGGRGWGGGGWGGGGRRGGGGRGRGGGRGGGGGGGGGPVLPRGRLGGGGPGGERAGARGAGAVGLAPDVWDHTAFVRPQRRLNINQLDAALQRATNVPLTTRLSSRSTAGLLGLPDYLTSNQEDLRPGVVFTKTVQDIIYHHCWRVVREE